MKSYLIIIDTTEGINLRSVSRGLLNVHIILAESEALARENFLKVFNPVVANQIRNNLYVYDIVEIMLNLEKVDIKTSLPLYSFLPLAGGRPPKQNDQFAENNTPVNPQQPFIDNKPKSATQPHQNDDQKQVYTKEQLELIARLGAVTSNNTSEVNPRIAASTGLNSVNQQQVNPTQRKQVVNSTQHELLKRFGDAASLQNTIQTNQHDEVPVLTDADRARMLSEAAPLSDAELDRLKAEVAEVTKERGI